MSQTAQHKPHIPTLIALALLLVFPTITKAQTEITALSDITNSNGNYIIKQNISGGSPSVSTFSGTLTAQAKSDGTFPVISGLTQPLFTTATNATISNIMLKNVTISQTGYVGAIACTANGTTRIYNCGILPTTNNHPDDNTRSTVTSTNNHCGSLVGYLDGYARVVNCFSYANVSAGTANNICAGGLVGRNNVASNQQEANLKTMVVNCMFYGDIKAGKIKRPVYGGERIKNTNVSNSVDYGLNNYNFYCKENATFDNNYSQFSDYNCSMPVATKYLTRFEVYRNLLNSNRRLCTWWVDGTYNSCPTDADVESIGIAKWVLDKSIAPYPILKKWGKYYSTFDIDPNQVWYPKSNSYKQRSSATKWEGKSNGALSVTIKSGSHHTATAVTKNITITDMDTLGYDYCAYKIQLPYYNEVFGNPNGVTWSDKYGDNYTDSVVTGWKITVVTSDPSITNYHGFVKDWESGYDFADRHCIDKDLFATSGRVFAQGGYYYIPDGVTAITIEAYWGKAVYLHNPDHYLDRVGNASASFVSAGALPDKINNTYTIQTSLSSAVSALAILPSGNVYDQAIVLVGNYQQNDFHNNIKLNGSQYNSSAKPFTIMSADFDFDNEPDFCFQAGMSGGGRINCHPIRFDFLMAPDLAMTARASANYYGMRIFCPQGHYEITETSYLYITQFEYDIRPRNTNDYKPFYKTEAPMILNGGEFCQIVSSEIGQGISYGVDSGSETTASSWGADKTSYFILGGHLWMKAFTPGVHGNSRMSTRHCAVNAIGGEFSEFYLSGMFRTDFYNKTDNPHAYLDGGKFDLVAGAGMESIGGKNETNGGDVTFKINHSWIKEFYGGGINANRPVTGTISTTCNNSIVHKYCGGPKLGDMSASKTITNTATGTIFGQYFGGGNGGTNLARVRIYDSNGAVAAPTQANANTQWDEIDGGDYGSRLFSAFRYVDGGYEVEFEFELLPDTRGKSNVVKRTYHYIATFSKTEVAPITNTIKDCTFKGNYYGGGNLGAVGGATDAINVTSTLSGHTVVHGSVFGGGLSASASSVAAHDKTTMVYPYRDFAGFIHDGSLDYLKYGSACGTHSVGDTIQYTWIHDVPNTWGWSNPDMENNPVFEYPENSGNWYCYTSQELTGLGTVTGNVKLTLQGTTEVSGNVFGGGDESTVRGNTTVILEEGATVSGNVYGGGNEGPVGGDSEVIIQNQSKK